MGKLKQPLFSLGAHGSLGDALTYQERHQQTFVRKKPTPRQPSTLAQIYHQWDYQDYASLWHSLSAAEKQQYESDARRSRITGFNLWMRNSLNDLPNLLLRAYLDEGEGAVANDSSRGGHNGTLIAPTWVDGRLGKALSFDGIDDFVNFGQSLDLAPKRDFSVEILAYPKRTQDEYLYGRGWRYPLGVSLKNRRVKIDITNTVGNTLPYQFTTVLPLDTWSYILAVYDPDNLEIRCQVNTTQETLAGPNWDLQQPIGHSTFLGSNPLAPTLYDFFGYLDHFSLYSRAIPNSKGLTRYDRIRRQ